MSYEEKKKCKVIRDSLCMEIGVVFVSTIMKKHLDQEIVGVYVMVNANLSDYERAHDTNHQYVKKNDGYCVKCGHYPEVSYIRELECECDCHD